jgi:hypothetical protein
VSTTDREALAAIVDPIMEDLDDFFGPGRYTQAEKIVDAILAAGWRPPVAEPEHRVCQEPGCSETALPFAR